MFIGMMKDKDSQCIFTNLLLIQVKQDPIKKFQKERCGQWVYVERLDLLVGRYLQQKSVISEDFVMMKVHLFDSSDNEGNYDGKNNDNFETKKGICTECGGQGALGTICKSCEDTEMIYNYMDEVMLQWYQLQLKEYPIEGMEENLENMKTNGIELCVECISMVSSFL